MPQFTHGVRNPNVDGNSRVDNASTDGTAAYVHIAFPGVVLLANETNTGFAAGNNRALRAARGRFVLLLNPDTYVHTGALDALVTFMNERPEVWACGPPVFNADGSPQRTGVRFPGIWNLLVESLFLDRVFPRTRLFGAHRELYSESGTSPHSGLRPGILPARAPDGYGSGRQPR